MKTDYAIRQLCEAFHVSASGYYQWSQRQTQPGPRHQQNNELSERISRIHQESRQTYGAPRIAIVLRRQGHRHGRYRIARLMRQQGLCGRQKRRFRILTTQSRHDEPIAPNHLAQRPVPTAPNQVWVADITYVRVGQGWLYLAALLDLYSRRIVGWAMGPLLDTALVLRAWQMALTHRQPPKGLLFHSDRGVQYASLVYRQALQVAQAVASMSRKANCYDNACMESFWSTLKLELIYRQDFATPAEARLAIFDFIESFYNRQRLHSSLNYQSPVDFEGPTIN